ncbi:MAG TPA: hypothetical protein VFN57_18510, partial [Thermomicrobiaceae bacterium]|nr:hypothetical protein [Thermomicrobiaceae bacterium]
MDVQTTRDESAADRYARALIDAATREGLPELFGGEHPEALYRVADRNGVSVVVLTTAALSEAQLTTLMKYRLAQYLATNF